MVDLYFFEILYIFRKTSIDFQHTAAYTYTNKNKILSTKALAEIKKKTEFKV